MNTAVKQAMIEQRVVPVIRAKDTITASGMFDALVEGGMSVIELTTTIPNVYTLADGLRQRYPHVVVGMGTVVNATQARQAIDSGAQVLITYNVSQEVAQIGIAANIPYILGAATPTEVTNCIDLGSMLIKVFPANLLTPKFIQEIRGPIPSVQCFPTGGIALNQVSSWLQAGAAVVGVGGALLQLADGTQGYGVITQRAHQLLVSLSHLEQQGMDTKDN